MSDQPTFEQAMKELEEAVERLERGTLPLDESLACFEAGVRSANLCRKLLQNVEQQVEVLVKEADGELTVQTLEKDSDGDT